MSKVVDRTIFYVETSLGCALEEAKDAAEARRSQARECGVNNITRVRKATEEDISWVRGMGGYVPERKCDG